MTSNEILKADLLDIIFDNRNKAYGAFELRKNYASRLGVSLLLSLSLIILLLFFAGQEGSTSKTIIPVKPDVNITESAIPINKIPEPIPPAERTIPPPAAQASFQSFRLVEEPLTERELQPIAEIERAVIGNRNLDGPQHILTFNGTTLPADPRGGEGRDNDTEPANNFIAVEEQPQFPGGAAAWINFLNRNLLVPSSLENGERKTVLINFIVDVDGTVTGLVVLQSAGREFDNEVIRVLKKMPKWKPALQNGRPVAVPFTQPVIFVGAEQ